MTDKAISPLRRRLIEDMAIRRLGPKTQYHYIRHVKRFADFAGRSADKATAEDVRRYQLWLASNSLAVSSLEAFRTPAAVPPPSRLRLAGIRKVLTIPALQDLTANDRTWDF
jgi:hypothetical protein